MLCFFAMGFVDLVGIASNYVQADLGLFGGTVFPLLMGFASDAVGQVGAVAVMTIGVLYLAYLGTDTPCSTNVQYFPYLCPKARRYDR